MFVVKDLRKIPEILQDPEDEREQMRLGRRSAEFSGNLDVLCTPSNVTALTKLQKLSLYDNQLVSIERIGLLSKTPLCILDLGQNQLERLPDEIGSITTLKELWVSNNLLTEIPEAVLRLPLLSIVHLSNNRITHVPAAIGQAAALQVLSLDNNLIEDVPDDIGRCHDLVELNIRGNKVQVLPSSLGDCINLTTLAVNSNELKVLPESLGKCRQLTFLHANGNPILHFPSALVHFAHIRVNVANTRIASIDPDVEASWVVLTHLHVTPKESTLQEKSILILSGTPYAQSQKKKTEKP
ncbi:Aste57867_17909 [Aphanomyces stellatus]|uniref:Aste57867_17909 protein n=1 Tax=Aphanomyces stellatus TaxID=120398 RepID=A0A485L9Z5_9STRA|nr:hypothetical protein As57867_017848 [Aphanomyces stellatus]VFT94651.1 Aste57867_17909 [Aphanomyces stellatus]